MSQESQPKAEESRPACVDSHRPRWKPTSKARLEQVEFKILQCLTSTVESTFVQLPSSQHTIRTVILNKHHEGIPLVMLHGMGGAVGLWVQNMDELARKRPVYAFDLVGFGRSSRSAISKKAQKAEQIYVDTIDEWREQLGLDKFILLGHSFGAYLSAAYALQHPQFIKHLILADSWGFPEMNEDALSRRRRRIPVWIRVIATVFQGCNPLSAMRVTGPCGPRLVKRFRPDLQETFSNYFDDDTIFDYIYHCNARYPSGEIAFSAMQTNFGWSKNPMILRVGDIDKDIPMTMVQGSRSWIDKQFAYDTKTIRKESYVKVKVIEDAGHHVYADQPEAFNSLVSRICEEEDLKLLPGASLPHNMSSVPLFKTEDSTEVEEVPYISQL